jgi:catechol 2,3-dioxygenase-like lactoylglutathione lyase family enzyme
MKVSKILETCLYVDDLEAAKEFYTQVLGMEVYSEMENRHVFFRCGSQMLLLFNPEETSTQRPGMVVPTHGANGPGHVAFHTEQSEISDWKRVLRDREVEIETEIDWPRGGHSIYFRDPAGNSVELATVSMWK